MLQRVWLSAPQVIYVNCGLQALVGSQRARRCNLYLLMGPCASHSLPHLGCG